MATPRTTADRAQQGLGTVVAYTTQDDEHAAVRLAAVQHARDHGCTVILYAADAASAWEEPLPNQWASEGEDKRFGDRLTTDDLEFLGRQVIADQVREAQAGGVEASGWLPKDHGPQALAEYARQQGAHRVFVPDELETIDEVSALLAGESDAVETIEDRPGIDVERVKVSEPAR
jgi:hypothetical protein